jgi:putative ABC transport system ATP-binding protein
MQRVAVARALIMDPPLILADEPTGNLDSKTGAAILELLGSITEAGNSVVMVTHDMGAAHYCDRVITLRDGRIGSIVAGEHAGRTAHDHAGPHAPDDVSADDAPEPAAVRSGIAEAQAVRP